MVYREPPKTRIAEEDMLRIERAIERESAGCFPMLVFVILLAGLFALNGRLMTVLKRLDRIEQAQDGN